ncbi:hypothetical protein EIN_222530 [Entamoeba invadens IP1]|uniref:BRO1 domain-containing protein n=1 Tax=Entamoeba invadens IP1 TaxID=370355 RepID=A0A0A1U5I1_ENTIV|nr:hypothetical protein EIN_222530 [Entamoeba invadens IP1]ELP88100.1 hypothetical protein EIN_222530 [Entamoeba invadens IP1]|eukprot:XP_004254871.1 hypothetical protein EIN_222530 [Entamoeba invadens IP1]
MTNILDVIPFPIFRLKQTTSAQIYQPIVRAISAQFGTISQNITNTVGAMQKSRDQLVTTTNADLVIKSSIEYYNNLHNLSQRVALSSINVQFSWTDTVKKEQTSCYLFCFETANVLYNVGVAHMILARQNFRTDLKDAIEHIKNAAFCFSEASNAVVGNERVVNCLDIMPEATKALSSFCMLAVQYMYYQKAILESRSETIQMKLASGVYKVAVVMKDTTKAAKQCIPHHIYASSMAFEKLCVADVQRHIAAVDAKENLKYGEQISRMMWAIDNIDAASRTKDLPKEFKGTFDTVLKTFKAELTQMQKDNDEVYMQNIPEAASLEYPEATVLAKEQAFQFEGENPFKELLPLKIRAAYNQYMAKAKKVIDDTKLTTPASTKAGEDYLERIKLKEVIEIVKNPQRIPSDVEKFATEFGNLKQFDKLQESMEMMNKSTQKNDDLIAEIKHRLDEEALKDNDGIVKYRNYWTINLASNQHSLIAKIREVDNLVSQSKRSDVETSSKMKLNADILNIIQRGKEGVAQFFPTKEETERAMPIIVRMEELKGEWEQLIIDRNDLLQTLLCGAEAQESNLIDELNKTSNQEGVVNNYSEQLKTLVAQMQKSFDLQTELLGKITSEHAELQLVLGEKVVELNVNIDKIHSAMKAAGEIRDEVSSSISNHSFVLQKLIELKQEVFTFCERHAFDVDDLLKKLQSANVQPQQPNVPTKQLPPLPPKQPAVQPQYQQPQYPPQQYPQYSQPQQRQQQPYQQPMTASSYQQCPQRNYASQPQQQQFTQSQRQYPQQQVYGQQQYAQQQYTQQSQFIQSQYQQRPTQYQQPYAQYKQPQQPQQQMQQSYNPYVKSTQQGGSQQYPMSPYGTSQQQQFAQQMQQQKQQGKPAYANPYVNPYK